MKRVSFETAKALKEAGYPQDNSNNNPYYTKDGQFSDLYHYGVPYYDVDCFAPTYLEVWLWLWRKGNIKISLHNEDSKYHYYTMKNSGNHIELMNSSMFNDPEEAIIAAIQYLMNNNLIK